MTAEAPPLPAEEPDATIGVGSVGRDAHSIFTGNSGPVTVNNWSTGPPRKRPGPLVLDAQHAEVLSRLFVEPASGWPEARERLAQDHVVLLRGEPDTGRRTAAWRLLLDAGDEQGKGPVQELSPIPDEDGGRILRFDEIAEEDRFLLDLSSVGDEEAVAAQRELPGFTDTVRRQGAWLAVLLPAGAGHVLLPELRARTVQLGSPDRWEVLRRHLEEYGINVSEAKLRQLVPKADAHGPGRLALLAHLAGEIRHRNPSASPANWVEEARRAAFDRGHEVARLVDELSEARSRALLLAAAMFDGADSETVVEAERRLLATVEHNDPGTADFDCDGLQKRLEAVKGDLTADGVVRFRELNHAAAARAHFWTAYPSLRPRFRDWMIGCGDLMPSTDVDLAEQVARLVDECLRVRRHSDVKVVVEKWADDRGLPPALAGLTLTQALGHPREGWALRRQCYRWATRSEGGSAASPRLADLVVSACRDVIAQTHPEQAIVRLRHLAGHDDETVAAAARAALVAVIDDREGRLRYFIGRATGGSTRRQRRADARSLLAVVDPDRLVTRGRSAAAPIHDPALRTRVAERWRDALDLIDVRALSQWARRWLDTAVGSHEVLSVLVEACAGNVARNRALERLADGWLGTDVRPQARVTVDQLVSALDAAVAVAITTRSHDTTTDTTTTGPKPGSYEPGEDDL